MKLAKDGVLALRNRFAILFAAVSIVAILSACAEDFAGGAACPVLCHRSPRVSVGFAALSRR